MELDLQETLDKYKNEEAQRHKNHNPRVPSHERLRRTEAGLQVRGPLRYSLETGASFCCTDLSGTFSKICTFIGRGDRQVFHCWHSDICNCKYEKTLLFLGNTHGSFEAKGASIYTFPQIFQRKHNIYPENMVNTPWKEFSKIQDIWKSLRQAIDKGGGEKEGRQTPRLRNKQASW